MVKDANWQLILMSRSGLIVNIYFNKLRFVYTYKFYLLGPYIPAAP